MGHGVVWQVVELQAELTHVKQVNRYEEIEAGQAAAKADVEAAQKAAQAEVEAMRAQIRCVFLLYLPLCVWVRACVSVCV
jgi:hypothetical protein